jgi:hypothetical protein
VPKRREVARWALLLGLVVLLIPASASATWGGGKCALGSSSHCYSLQTWEMEGGSESVKGAQYYSTTSLMSVQEYASGAFVDDEMWLGFDEKEGVIALSPVTGTISGTLDVSGGPPKKRPPKHAAPPLTHAVLVQRGGKTVKVAHTNGRGAFSVRVAPGTYALKGTVGADCQSKTVTVKAKATVRVKLSCSIR